MKISLNSLRFLNQHYGSAGEPAPSGVDDLLRKIGAQLGAVEDVIQFGKQFDGVVIVKISSCSPHPSADRLKICMVDDDGAIKDVERDQNGHVQVVCGAPNVRAGLLVAWLPPGSTVPNTVGKDPFVLEVRELRGQKSNGMLASAKELGLSDDHDGILEIDEELGPITPGTSFSDVFHLRDDVVIDIENKMFTHRPDCFGWLGIAREIAGIYNLPYKSPDWYQLNPKFPAIEVQPLNEQLELEVHNELPKLVPRFTAITLKDIQIKPSPVWLQVDLARAGLRPINNIVDYTNWYMVLTGQPIHAYDYDKVKALTDTNTASLTVRHPKPGEKITLLNGKTIEPWPEAIMIASGEKLIGVGGVMGGADTEVDKNTKNIIIECANFDMYSVRRTSMAHGLFTDAVTRFNKGQSPLQNLAVLAKIVDQVQKYAGGKVASPVIDDNHVPKEAMERGSLNPSVKVSAKFINDRLGLKLTIQEVRELLENVEFKFSNDADKDPNDSIEITAPFWRTDIEIPEDIVEEVGRLKGYDQLPTVLPLRPTAAARLPVLEQLKSQTRDILVAAGNNELHTYSFVSSKLLNKTGQEVKPAFKLRNAMSPELELIRTSLLPSLIDKVHPNHKAGYDKFGLFDIGKTHNRHEIGDDNLPAERIGLSYVFSAEPKAAAEFHGSAFYQAKYNLNHLLGQLGVEYILQPLNTPKDWWLKNIADLFEPKRSAVILVGGQPLGIVGEFKSEITHNFKLPSFAAGFELDLSALLGQYNAASRYRPLLRFPATEQDICFKVDVGVSYQAIETIIRQTLAEDSGLRYKVAPISIYQAHDDTTHKQINYRLSLQHQDHTLTTDYVNGLLEKVAQKATSIPATRV
ncbi:MAG TPA: phenylalanine--tRNA ligase subunit beta [Patescibacteria group bacterium]|jgi:phenylalanyl-tRNA synthetase beta chain|nr:phenylalanine--tRNA ligase subunit beta [Patescibacteria group bacterium]